MSLIQVCLGKFLIFLSSPKFVSIGIRQKWYRCAWCRNSIWTFFFRTLRAKWSPFILNATKVHETSYCLSQSWSIWNRPTGLQLGIVYLRITLSIKYSVSFGSFIWSGDLTCFNISITLDALHDPSLLILTGSSRFSLHFEDSGWNR